MSCKKRYRIAKVDVVFFEFICNSVECKFHRWSGSSNKHTFPSNKNTFRGFEKRVIFSRLPNVTRMKSNCFGGNLKLPETVWIKVSTTLKQKYVNMRSRHALDVHICVGEFMSWSQTLASIFSDLFTVFYGFCDYLFHALFQTEMFGKWFHLIEIIVFERNAKDVIKIAHEPFLNRNETNVKSL